MIKRLSLTVMLLVATITLAIAQTHSHGEKGPNGGPMQDVIGVHAELLVADRTLTVHVYNEAGQPVSVAGFSGSALVGSGQSRQVVQLKPGSDNTLTGTAAGAIAKGASVTLQIKGADGKTGQVKF